MATFIAEYPVAVFLLRLAVAIIIFVVGRKLAHYGRTWVSAALTKAALTESLIILFSRLTSAGILLLAIVLALAVMGVSVTLMVTVIGLAILVLGIALQESLSNLAATVLFLLFQPFRVGDIVETAGVMGVVKEIQLFHTVILTFDNKTVTAPNSKIQDSNIVNYSRVGILRADVVVDISYSDDISRVKQVLADILAADNRVLADPPPTIAILDFGDSGIKMGVRPFVKLEDYWNMQFDLRERIKERFDAEGITIPFPQRDVHLLQQGA